MSMCLRRNSLSTLSSQSFKAPSTMRDTGTFPISANAFARKIKRGGSVSAICWRWNFLGRVGLAMGFIGLSNSRRCRPMAAGQGCSLHRIWPFPLRRCACELVARQRSSPPIARQIHAGIYSRRLTACGLGMASCMNSIRSCSCRCRQFPTANPAQDQQRTRHRS